MAVIVRVLGTSFLYPGPLSSDWGLVVAAISALTMTLGNLMALQQTNIKRLLAYSGIAHTGYMLIAIAVLGLSRGAAGQEQMLFYMAAFALAEMAVFAAVIVITRHLNTDETGNFAGLGRRSPFLSSVLSLGLISLTGLPPTAGFMAKLFIFTGAVDYGLLWLIIIAVLNTVISAYYYFRIIKIMWVDQPNSTSALNLPLVPGLVAGVSAAGLLLLGMAPYLLIQIAGFSLISSP
jgi:NADH-quinone oxidoreductase subunit N